MMQQQGRNFNPAPRLTPLDTLPAAVQGLTAVSRQAHLGILSCAGQADEQVYHSVVGGARQTRPPPRPPQLARSHRRRTVSRRGAVPAPRTVVPHLSPLPDQRVAAGQLVQEALQSARPPAAPGGWRSAQRWGRP